MKEVYLSTFTQDSTMKRITLFAITFATAASSLFGKEVTLRYWTEYNNTTHAIRSLPLENGFPTCSVDKNAYNIKIYEKAWPQRDMIIEVTKDGKFSSAKENVTALLAAAASADPDMASYDVVITSSSASLNTLDFLHALSSFLTEKGRDIAAQLRQEICDGPLMAIVRKEKEIYNTWADAFKIQTTSYQQGGMPFKIIFKVNPYAPEQKILFDHTGKASFFKNNVKQPSPSEEMNNMLIKVSMYNPNERKMMFTCLAEHAQNPTLKQQALEWLALHQDTKRAIAKILKKYQHKLLAQADQQKIPTHQPRKAKRPDTRLQTSSNKKTESLSFNQKINAFIKKHKKTIGTSIGLATIVLAVLYITHGKAKI